MFFDKCRTLEELKAEYKRLALRHHPDVGGDEATMKAVNADYDTAFERISRSRPTSEAEAQEDAETSSDFKEIIDALLKIDGIEIELCGSWLWISGETYAAREQLKAAGCRWSKGKGKWYWHPPKAARRHGSRSMSMGWIRNKYGSKVIGKTSERQRLTA